jgi:integrase
MASITKTATGKYRARWRDDTGATQSKTFAKRVLAENHVKAVEHALLTDTYVDARRGLVTFQDYAKEWRAQQIWRPSTESAMRYSHERANALIGSQRMSSIRTSHLQKMVKQLADHVAPATLAHTFSAVSAVFASAVTDRVIATNPALGVKLPKADRPLVNPLTSDQVVAIADAMSEPRLRGLVLFGALTGMRISECLGLTRDRVDFLRKTVRVDHQLAGVDDEGQPVFAAPKTKASRRVIPVGQAAVDVLAEHLAAFPARPDGLVFTRADGLPWHRNRVAGAFASARDRAKVPAATFHDLRHHYASVLISAGCSVKAVQTSLGHSSAAMTLDIYSHLMASDEDRIRDAVDAAHGVPTLRVVGEQ